MKKKHILNTRQEHKGIIELSPRLLKCTHHGGNQLLGQISGEIKRRKVHAKHMILPSSFGMHSKLELKKMNMGKKRLTQQQIRDSCEYRMLQQDLRDETKRQQKLLQKLRDMREERIEQMKIQSRQQYNTKLQIWQLKNKIIGIKNEIKNEENQIEHLVEQLRPYDSQEDDEEFGVVHGEGYVVDGEQGIGWEGGRNENRSSI